MKYESHPPQQGCVWLVGAGPGDAGLLTRKAEKCLKEASIVLHDRLVSEEILALIPTGTARIFAGKSCKIHYMTQQETNQVMIELARQGHRVVRLKGGDPFIFGRGGEEAQALAKAGVSFEVVPGISAAQGCAASGLIPLTHRDACHSLRSITGHVSEEESQTMDWRGLTDSHTTLVVYMGLANAKRVSQKLIEYGRPPHTPVAAIMNGTRPNERRIDSNLNQIAEDLATHQFESPTLLIIGEVVAISAELWSEVTNNLDHPDLHPKQSGLI